MYRNLSYFKHCPVIFFPVYFFSFASDLTVNYYRSFSSEEMRLVTQGEEGEESVAGLGTWAEWGLVNVLVCIYCYF